MKLIKAEDKYINPTTVEYLWLREEKFRFVIVMNETFPVKAFPCKVSYIPGHEAEDAAQRDRAYAAAMKYLDELAAQVEAALSEEAQEVIRKENHHEKN